VFSLIGLSIEGLTSFSVAPLRVASLLGLLLAFAALIFGTQILIETLVYGQSVPGYPSVIVGLMVLGGVQLIMIGVMGEYIGKILSELKARPVYFVAEYSQTVDDVNLAKDADENTPPDRRPSSGRVAAAVSQRQIWLCADDYGISPGVSQAIRELIAQERLNATSVMVVAPSFHRSEADALSRLLTHGAQAAIGLHLTLSAPFRPLTDGFTPLTDGAFLSHRMMLVQACLRRLIGNR
jgi:hypothetical protein